MDDKMTVIKLQKCNLRINSMGFDEKEKDFIFCDWPNWDEHLDWLLTASRAEIVSWGEATEWGKEE